MLQSRCVGCNLSSGTAWRVTTARWRREEQMSADLAALEFANDAFYQAFAAASLEAMEAVWAEQPNVFCIHPGWQPITNRAEVMASWKEILSNAGPIPVRCVAPKATIFGEIGLV